MAGRLSIRRSLALFAVAALLGGCAGWRVAAPQALSALPGWNDDDLQGLRQAIDAQCGLSRMPAGWTQLCASRPAPGGLRRWLETAFAAWPLDGDDGSPIGLLTGYHEPLLTGSLERESPNQVPLYTRPVGRDPHSLPTRAEIDAGALEGTPVLVWVDDAIDAFFLQVQGSGRIALRDGRVLRVGFAGHNGRTYRSIGRELIERGELTPADADADAIRAWLRAHPDRAAAVMESNPRYVFFRRLDGVAADQGPPGSLGVPLTAMRSLAVDPARISPGTLVYLSAQPPDGDTDPGRWNRIGIAQDTGAAIRGAVRADLFTGSDAAAASLAARLRQPMRAWQLLPVGEPPAAR